MKKDINRAMVQYRLETEDSCTATSICWTDDWNIYCGMQYNKDEIEILNNLM